MTRRLRVALIIALLASMLGSAAPGTVAMAADPPGPVARWTFDEASGNVVEDVVGGLDGTMTGGVTRLSSGAPQGSGALAFDGVDDLVTIASGAALEQTGPFTVAAWFRADPLAAGTMQTLLAKGSFGCQAGGSWALENDYMTPRASARLTTWNDTMPVGAYGPGYPWYDGAWHLVVFSVDPAAGESTYTIDGHTSVMTWAAPDTVRYTGPDLVTPDLHVGGYGATCAYRDPFEGALDDVRVWDRELGRAEILALLPTYATTTTVKACVDGGPCPEGPGIGSAYADQRLQLGVHVTPWPAEGADVTWYRAKDGGAEEAFATTPLGIVNTTGYAWTYVEAGSLDEGAFTIRASWPGAANWSASSSASLPLDIVRRPVTMELRSTPASILPGESVTLTARIALDEVGSSWAVPGSIDFYDTTGDGEVLLGSGTLGYTGDPHWNTATLAVPSVAAGVHSYEARFAGTDTIEAATATLSATAGIQASTLGLTFSPNPVLNTEHGTAFLWLSTYRQDGDPTAGLPAPTGTLTLKAYPAGTVIASTPVVGNGDHQVQLPLYPVGTRSFVAEYSGDAHFAPATSEVQTLTIAQDVVDATAGVKYSTFYPYRDGYRDTNAIRGVRNEAASVSIKVTSPTGKTVRSGSFAIGTGAYSLTWNGRRSDGSMLPAGTYTVTQTLNGADGSRLVVTSRVVLSAKRLYTYTKTLTQSFPDQVDYAGSGWAGWQFRLPAAAVYKRIVFAVDAKSNRPLGRFGPQDYTECSPDYVGPGCTSPRKALTTTRRWVSLTGSPSRNVSSGRARLFIWMNGANVWVWRARVTVTYGVLK